MASRRKLLFVLLQKKREEDHKQPSLYLFCLQLPSNPHEKEKNENTKSFQSHIMVEVKSIRVSKFMRSMRFLVKNSQEEDGFMPWLHFNVSCGRRCFEIGWLTTGVEARNSRFL
jgi:hypothetical protein